MRWLLSLLTHKLRSSRSKVLPSDQPLSTLLHLVKVGYLAMEIADKLSYKNKDINKLFFEIIISKPETLILHRKSVISAASHMLEWCEKGSDLPEKISLYQAENNVIRAMYDVHFDHKNDLLPERVNNRVSLKHKYQDIWLVYRDVLAAATGNKLMLIEAHEVERFKNGVVLSEGRIEERSDVSVVRNEARKCFEARHFSKTVVMSFLLVLSEAMTNVYKHAGHGKVMIVEQDEAIHFIVEDSGKGIPLEQLPKAALLSGYSTQNSMGQGFTLMLKIASCVYLHTSEKGSIFVLTFALSDRTKGDHEITDISLNEELEKQLDEII
ncbi:ATP-binding protein [Jeotgalibacillus haloalkalitolerans]|uniref:ATP-binding protein n=1 Tax=Jeotgalibacillus haloalkalitolerans TaxID=3104292 RepID=A0ABU5KJU9_9BACL|nr:ATP-binding protein [Jeotgalibacillus sp. HH7-29]MDZ5711460.1 ATP-binding protein [Jeotgalibacillus sp. HH7-29]